MTIGPSIDPDKNVAAVSPPAEGNAQEQKKRVPLLWIPVTIGIGLAIAAIYLRGRIITAQLDATPPSIAKAPPQPAPIQPLAVVPAAEFAPEAYIEPVLPAIAGNTEDPLATIEPQAGQRYIQVGALNLESAQRFMRLLRAEKLEPHLAPGPNRQLLRVLIGPFQTPDALIEQKTRLRERNIDSFVRKY